MHQSYPRRTIIVSEAVAGSEEVLKKLQQAEQGYVENQLRLLKISQSFSEQGRPAGLTDYLSRCFSNITSDCGPTDKLLSRCKQLRTCTEDSVHNGATHNLFISALSMLSAFKTSHETICSKEQFGFCPGIRATDNFYAWQHRSLNDLNSSIEIDGTSYTLYYPNTHRREHVPAYKLHIVTPDDVTYKEVSNNLLSRLSHTIINH